MEQLSRSDFFVVVSDAMGCVIRMIDERYCDVDIDVDEHDDVVKIELVKQKKVFVVNRNSYLQELWYSSPVTGPKHFRYDLELRKWLSGDFEFFNLIFSEIDYLLCKS